MAEAAWLECSLIVDGEIAEAVAEVLARYAPDGVAIESTHIQDQSDGPGIPTGPVKVTAYLPIDDQVEEKRQKIEQGIWHLSMITAMPSPIFTPIENQNWMEAWKENFRPLLVGERLIVLPSWVEDHGHGRIPLIIEPGMAFGTGTHPTTQLSLMLMEKYVQPGETFFDIGCGSGILGVAALKLGAAQAYGVDVQPEAADLSAKNIELNGIEPARFPVVIGSVADIAAGAFPVKTSPVVVANILTHILIQLLEDGMANLLAPGGTLILSGILAEKEPELREALIEKRLRILERRQMGDWVALAAVAD